MSYDDYRREILILDGLIQKEIDKNKLKELIKKDINLNLDYRFKLGLFQPLRIILCILLFVVGIGILMIPAIAVRSTKINACTDRIEYLKRLLNSLGE